MLRVLALCSFGLWLSCARGVASEPGRSEQPLELIVAPSPSGQHIAVARRIPARDLPDRVDLDSALVVIRERDSHAVVTQYVIGGRVVTKLLWAPDGEFLAVATESSGGHSSWRMSSYFWSRADQVFRSVDYCAGIVVSDDFSFEPPHTLAVQVAVWHPDGYWDARIRSPTPLILTF